MDSEVRLFGQLFNRSGVYCNTLEKLLYSSTNVSVHLCLKEDIREDRK